jgi:hypothetical protein
MRIIEHKYAFLRGFGPVFHERHPNPGLWPDSFVMGLSRLTWRTHPSCLKERGEVSRLEGCSRRRRPDQRVLEHPSRPLRAPQDEGVGMKCAELQNRDTRLSRGVRPELWRIRRAILRKDSPRRRKSLITSPRRFRTPRAHPCRAEWRSRPCSRSTPWRALLRSPRPPLRRE